MPSGQPGTVVCPDPERLWPSLIAAVHEYALLLLDPDGRILSWNRAAELIKGYAADEIMGRHFSCLYPPEDVAAGMPERELVTAAATGRCETIGERVRKDGSRFLANVVITAIRGPTARCAASARSPRHHRAHRRGGRGQGQRDQTAQPDRHRARHGGRRPDHHRPPRHHPVLQQGLRQPVRLHAGRGRWRTTFVS